MEAITRKIVVITNKRDTTADLIVLAAERHGVQCLRVNTEDMPSTRCTVQDSRCRIHDLVTGRVTMIEGGDSIIYRRPSAPPFGDSGILANWIAEQWHDLVSGLESIPGVKWLARPSALSRAENKLLQLRYAQEVGLTIPHTVVTNDREAWTNFADMAGSIVVKPLATGLVGSEANGRFIYAAAPETTPLEGELAIAPVILQHRINVELHLRVTVIGPDVCAVSFRSEELDWRTSGTAPTLATHELSADLESRVQSLVRRFDLAFSSMDIVLSGGVHYFLDLNPNGEWAWIERGAGVPIADRIVRFLMPSTSP